MTPQTAFKIMHADRFGANEEFRMKTRTYLIAGDQFGRLLQTFWIGLTSQTWRFFFNPLLNQIHNTLYELELIRSLNRLIEEAITKKLS